jgi:hypothetical protein
MEKMGIGLILYFGIAGFFSLLFLILTIIYWSKKSALIEHSLKVGSRWKLMGYIFLFFGSLFLCGAIWKPGALYSQNPNFHIALPILLSSKGFFLIGWLSLFIGEIQAYKFFLSKK